MKRHWPLLLILALAGLIIRQSSALQMHRAEVGELSASLTQLTDTSSVAAEPRVEQDHVSPDELEELEERAGRIHRLRGDVTTAMQQEQELSERVQSLTARVRDRTNNVANGETPGVPPEYIHRDDLRNRGNETPEATLESFFFGNVHGDILLLRFVMPGSVGGAELDALAHQKMADEIRQVFDTFPGYQIVSREEIAEDEVRIRITTTPRAVPTGITLKLTNGRWVVSERNLFE